MSFRFCNHFIPYSTLPGPLIAEKAFTPLARKSATLFGSALSQVREIVISAALYPLGIVRVARLVVAMLINKIYRLMRYIIMNTNKGVNVRVISPVNALVYPVEVFYLVVRYPSCLYVIKNVSAVAVRNA